MWKNTNRSVLKPKIAGNAPVPPPHSPQAVNAAKPFRGGAGAGAETILFGGAFGGGIDTYGPDIAEITYFSVLRIFAETMGKLPVYVRDKDHNIIYNDVNYRVSVQPNSKDNASNLFSFLEYSRIHYGNGYAYCDWAKDGKLKAILPLNPNYVRIWIDDETDGIGLKHYYSYTMPTNGRTYMISPDDVIHVKTWHLDDMLQMVGIPVRETLHEYMIAAMAGQKTQNDMYKNGMISSGVLNYVGDLSEDRKQKLIERTKQIGKSSKIIPLPQDWKITPINLSLADNQYLETRRYTGLQIAAAFGISPNQLNDYSKATYSNAAAQEVAFLTGAMQYISKIYEDEMSRKLLSDEELRNGIRVDVDTDALLKNTPEQLANLVCNYVKNSVMTINEARSMAGLPSREDGDKLMTMPGAGTVGGGTVNDSSKTGE